MRCLVSSVHRISLGEIQHLVSGIQDLAVLSGRKPPGSGNLFDALHVEGSAVEIQSADDFYWFLLILPGPLLVIELIRRIVTSLQDVFLPLPHNDAFNLPRCLRPGLGTRGLARLRVGLLIRRRRRPGIRLGQRHRLLQVRPCY